MIGDWRWFDFTSGWKSKWEQGEELAQWITRYCVDSEDGNKSADALFRACAKAMTSPQVRAELEQYNLTDDFEVSVFNGDEARRQRNYCQLIRSDK